MEQSDVCMDRSQTYTRDSWRHRIKSVSGTTRGLTRALESQHYSRSRKRQNKLPANCAPISKPQQFAVIKTTVQNLNLEYVKPQRAGVIIYTVVNGSIYFGLGLDSRTHDLTDFGGGVYYKLDTNAIRGALREFEEETLGIFDPISPTDITQCPVVYDNRNLIIFVHMNVDPETVCFTFNEKFRKIVQASDEGPRKKRRSEPEVCGITWLTWEEFQDCINSRGKLFSRVQKFLARAGGFAHLL